MKTFIKSVFAALLTLATLSSCDTNLQPEATSGTLSLKSMGVEVDDAMNVVSRANPQINLNNFIVRVSQTGGIPQEFVYGEMPEILTLPTGDYTVEVLSHQVMDAEWDKPLYTGSKTFTIEDKKITEIGVVTCKFSNLRISVKFSDKLKDLLGDDVKVTVQANESGLLEFAADETRSGYFKVTEGSNTIIATLSGTIAGNYMTETRTFTDAAAGQHRIINYSLTPGPDIPEQTGDIEPGGISIDTTFDNVDLEGGVEVGEDPITGDDPGKEDPVTPPGPGPIDDEPVATFTAVAPLDLDGVNDAATYSGDAIVKIHCPNGFAHLMVKIDSEGLTEEVLEGVGLASSFDLAYPGALEDGIAGLGFPYGKAVIDKTDVDFVITDFVPLLNIYSGSHNFIITVTDNKNMSISQTLKFKS